MLGSKVVLLTTAFSNPPYIHYDVYVVMIPCYRSEEDVTIGEISYLHTYSNNEDIFGSVVRADTYTRENGIHCECSNIQTRSFYTSNWRLQQQQSLFFHDAYEAQPYSDEVTIGDACLGVVPMTINKTGKSLVQDRISLSFLLQRAQQLKYSAAQQNSNLPP